ncbi:MAG TPA: LLM class flavin-dependent oxidoreductase [Thermoanaerobaculia bacterium]|nr:LLM class flavin-dependent oxidoreductase [Thermoanaerobaculia bacterium]
MAQAADGLGFHRYWIGEHHSQYQCANPLLLATVLAGLTARIRLGTGGVCLGYGNPYRIAEDARLANYLFPGRLDLGVARGLPYAPALLAALGGGGAGGSELQVSFAERAEAVHQYVTGRLPTGHPLAGSELHLEPGPPVWILGNSPASARLAARLGAGFCISLHHRPELEGARAAIADYTAAFSPSPEFPEPATIAVVSGVCAETAADAEAAAARIAGQAADGGIALAAAPLFVGDPAACAEKLTDVAGRLAIDELMILDFLAESWPMRLRMYELLAMALGPRPAA